uniref:EAL domain-containing protein n=1 Tax=Eubacterium cellulosolvens TaxID=29322 RepID=UPI0006843156|nr:EAL domain-containing protein [[Eubacterium] cellulosolvens]
MGKNIRTACFRHELFFKAFDSMPGGFFIYRADESEEVLYANKYVLEMYECDTEEEFLTLTDGTFRKMVHPEEIDDVERDICRQICSGNDLFDHVSYRIRTKTGKIKYIEDFGRLVHLEEVGDVYYVFVSDRDIKYMSYDIDRLTGLPGQRRFLAYAETALRNYDRQEADSNVAFLYINISKFKIFNVRFGMSAGDLLLQDIAALLRETFSDGYTARFADDHFAVYVEKGNLEQKIQCLNEALDHLRNETKIRAKIGIYRVKDCSVAPELACDLAKLSCDSIRNNPDKNIEEYTDEIGHKLEVHEYVLDHIDEAIENHYIKVYYQPVVRSVSGALCGFEALARWIDPKVGFLPPSDFVPTLEESRQIHKLDCYMIREICRNYRDHVDANEAVVPVSFNLSSIDFIACDIGGIVDEAVEEFRVPREMINIEITESMFIQDAQRIGREIDRFHGRGYQVWMDDFGSGYSSLNLLKDFTFDEMKIDMGFLSSFTQKSKDILESTVRMAKKIGIQTLAEGVETEEQFEFLRSIGCEKLQGYYFGKPMPYEESMKQCTDKGMRIETLAWRRYYDAVGKIDFLSDQPLAVIEDNGKEFRFLFANEKYLQTLRSNGVESLEQESYTMNRTGTVMGKMFREFVRTMIKWNTREHTLTYPSGNQFMRLNARIIACCNGYNMITVNLFNITRQTDEEEQAVRNGILKNIFYLYEDIALENIADDSVELFFLTGSGKSGETQGMKYGIDKLRDEYIRYAIYPEDRERYTAYSDPKTIRERVLATGNGFLADYFRTKGKDGNYRWMTHTTLVIPKSNDQLYLLICKEAAFENPVVRESLSSTYGRELFSKKWTTEVTDNQEITDELLWKNLRDFSRFNYFWKDKNRRFVGVCQSFLDYYGMSSEEEVLGKTDEEMQWHVADGPYKNDEERIISEGITVHDVPGKCIIKGTLHNIACTKVPIYRDGKIVGIIGYFVDIDKQNKINDSLKRVASVDTVTGLANIRGLIENMGDYIEEFRRNGVDFVVVHVEVEEYVRLREIYGHEAGDELLRLLAEILLRCFRHAASIGRFCEGEFFVLYRYEDQNDVATIVKKVKEEIHELHHVGDAVCSCFATITLEYAAMTEDPEILVVNLIQNSILKRKGNRKE